MGHDPGYVAAESKILNDVVKSLSAPYGISQQKLWLSHFK